MAAAVYPDMNLKDSITQQSLAMIVAALILSQVLRLPLCISSMDTGYRNAMHLELIGFHALQPLLFLIHGHCDLTHPGMIVFVAIHTTLAVLFSMATDSITNVKKTL